MSCDLWIQFTSLRPLSVRFSHLYLGTRNFSFLQIFWQNILAFVISYIGYGISTNIIESSYHLTPTLSRLCIIEFTFSETKPLYKQHYNLPALRSVKYVVLIYISNLTKIADGCVNFLVYTISSCQTAGRYLWPVLLERCYCNISQIIDLYSVTSILMHVRGCNWKFYSTYVVS